MNSNPLKNMIGKMLKRLFIVDISKCVILILFVFLRLEVSANLILKHEPNISDDSLQKARSKAFFDEANKKYDAGDFEGAIDLYTKAIGFNSQFALAYRNRGICRLETHEYVKALDDLTVAIELDSKDSLAFYFRAKVYRRTMRFELAIQDLDKALILAPNDADCLTDRGLCKFELKLYNEALSDLDKSLTINSYQLAAFINRGMVKMAIKDYTGAIEDYDKALQLKSNIPSVVCDRGLAMIHSGNTAEGCNELKKAQTLGFMRSEDLIKQFCK